VKLLLDTHILLWWLNGSAELRAEARELIANPENAVFVSAAAIWEIYIKKSLGKLELPDGFESALDASFEMLAIQAGHARAAASLPAIHRDPFDRILVAQAQVERLTLLTADAVLAEYGQGVKLVR